MQSVLNKAAGREKMLALKGVYLLPSVPDDF